MNRPPLSLPESLARSLGKDGVVPPERLECYATDGALPRLALRPAHRGDIAEIARWAGEEGLALCPWGGGVQMGLGNPPRRVDVALDLRRFDKILDYRPADLTATVEAGITLAALQRGLAAGGKTLAVESPLAGSAAIGGILATNASGPMRSASGLPRDWLIGLSVVGAAGVETKSGGKVVKNVTGYDLGKLYAGSLGTLGIIVEATFKLTPLPRRTGALTAGFPSLAEATAAANALSRQVYAPQGMQVLNGRAWERLSAGAGGEVVGPDGAMLAAFFSGRDGAVARQLRESAALLRAGNAIAPRELGPAEGARLLESVTDLGWDRESAPELGLKISVPPSASAKMLARPEDGPMPAPGAIADPGFGLLRLMWWDGAGVSDMVETIGHVREAARDLGGTAVLERAPLAVKRQIDVWGGAPEGIEIMRRLKEKLDPAGILNPGRYVGGI